ncbi:hypothetical protein [Caballeronia sp. LZ035]|uniref:hypothetical protein n=1 Tax=Caballeronia sp. LZ035 TaxID=3038568 RepID=UPI00285CFFB8|nr:hypothetical protein [Caballeronia sp. LZ035]MDR5761267.1 hypothetical protein [Caballeronia sp. LZ035]
MRDLNFSSWQTLLSTLFTLAVVTLIGVGVRLLLMQTVQQRRERANRQINERLRTLIAAYKTLGGSFTGNLAVDPTHLKDLRRASMAVPPAVDDALAALDVSNAARDPHDPGKTERSRRIRDSVEAALADIILLGTEEQVRLAAHAATEMVQGRPIHTAELVISLRDFIRNALDLDAVPVTVRIPAQGPARPSAAKGKQGEGQGGKGESGGGGGAGLGGGGGGMPGSHHADDTDPHHPQNN